MIARFAGRQNRCEKAADDAHGSERDRVLAHGEPARQRRDHEQQRECRAGRDERIQLESSEYGQIQHADAPALQDHRVALATIAKAPAKHQQHDAAKRNAGDAQFDRHGDVFGRVLEQKTDADEQHDDANACQRVAAGDPLPDAVRFGAGADGGR